jgi:hypothetical protein
MFSGRIPYGAGELRSSLRSRAFGTGLRPYSASLAREKRKTGYYRWPMDIVPARYESAQAAVELPDSPLSLQMQRIADIETELELLENGVPALYTRMREQLIPHFAAMATEYRELVLWLGEECHGAKAPKSLQTQIRALAQFLAERCLVHCGVNLSALLEEQGLAADPEPIPEFTAEQEEAWESFEWEDPQVWAERKKARPHKKNATGKETDEAALTKRIYHGLARDLHPDKATAEERGARTALMQKLNEAYKARNVRSLLALLAEHGSLERQAALAADALEPLLAALKKQQQELQKKLKQTLAGLPDWGVDWLALLRNTEQQERLLRSERKVASEREEHLRYVRTHLQEPRELTKFLSQYGDHAWDAIF